MLASLCVMGLILAAISATGAQATETSSSHSLPEVDSISPPTPAPTEAHPSTLLVGFKPRATLQARASIHAALGTRQLHAMRRIPVHVVEIPAGANRDDLMAAYRQFPDVAYVEPNYRVQASDLPNDTYFTNLWGLLNTGQSGGTPGADIGVTHAWALSTGSTNVVVAIIDTGIDYRHPDLASNMWVNVAEASGAAGVDDDGNGIVDDIHGARWVNGTGVPTSGDPFDDNDHGTHVAGTIGAIGNNNYGVVGVNWTVRLMALKFLSSNGSGHIADALSALEYALDKEAPLSNSSWGGGGYLQSFKDMVTLAGEHNHLLLIAAGNSNQDNDRKPSYPASYDNPNILAVAASDPLDERAYFSSYGLTSVDVAAPGLDILSTIPNSRLDTFSGTSMATPHAAGLSALLLSIDPSASYADLKRWIQDGATRLSSWQGLVATSGRINAKESCRLALLPTHVVAVTNVAAVSGQGESSVALSWDNPAGPEFERVTIRRNTQGFPASWNEGEAIYEGNAEAFEDGPLAAGLYAYYTFWAHYADGSYSAPAHIRCRVGGRPNDWFTEMFAHEDNDLAYHSMTFVPNGSANYYEAFIDPASSFPTDPSEGTPLAVTFQSCATVTLAEGNRVWLYGASYTSLYASAYGYITFRKPDLSYIESPSTHFMLPRISGLFDLLDPAPSNCISWKQMVDRVAITYQNMPEYGAHTENNFQIELFWDGKIRITWLALAARDGLAGLSDGDKQPADFVESDLVSSAYPPFDDLRVRPRAPLSYAGLEGGGFSPETLSMTLTNAGSSNLMWQAKFDMTWMSIAPTGGVLPAGAGTTVVARTAPLANGFGLGIYRDTLTFSNVNSHCPQPLPVTLYVQQEGRTALYYADVYQGENALLAALHNLGYAIAEAPSWSAFNRQLSTGSYSLAVGLNHQQTLQLDVEAVSNHLAGAGLAIIADASRNEALAELLEAGYTGYYNQNPVTIVNAELAAGVAAPMPLTSPGRTVWAMGLSADPEAESLAQFPNGNSAIVWGNHGRSALLGFAADTPQLSDGTAFFQNLATLLECGSDALRIQPPESFTASGYEGFMPLPESKTYTLTNEGASSIAWTARLDREGVAVAPSSGVLAPGHSAQVLVSLDSEASGWNAGDYENRLIVSNAATGKIRVRQVLAHLQAIPGRLVAWDSAAPTNDNFIPFGTLVVGQVGVEQITLHNSDPQHDLLVQEIYVEGVAAGGGGSSSRSAARPPPLAANAGAPPQYGTNVFEQPQYVPGQLLVGFRSKADQQSGFQLHAAIGAQRLHSYRHIATDVVQLPAGADLAQYAASYLSRPEVTYVEPNCLLHLEGYPNDPLFGQQWGLDNTGQEGGTPGADIQAVNAWDLTAGNRDVVVAVIDTGIDYTHPDLQANMWVNETEWAGAPGMDDDGNGIVDDIHGARWTHLYGAPSSGNPMDDHDHGTHVAGIIGAVGNNGVGMAGINWNVRLMALKFMDSSGRGSEADELAALDYALDKGARISNNSWGGGGYSQAVKNMLAVAAASNHLFVAAAGNSGTDNDVSATYPASYDNANILSVAASDRDDGRASFTCYGRHSVDVAAPGVDILSSLIGGVYDSFSGTSMSAPHVTGLAALLLSLRPGTSYAQLKEMILNGADPLPEWTDYTVTGGRINAWRSISLINPNFRPEALTYPLRIPPGESVTLDIYFTPVAAGLHTSRVFIVSNDTNTPVLAMNLRGEATPELMAVTPSALVDFSGDAGGPFTPEQTAYTVTNTGPGTLNWTVAASAPWVTLTPSNGALAAGETQTAILTLNEQAYDLEWGSHGASIVFSNHLSGLTYERRIRLITHLGLCDALDQCDWTWTLGGPSWYTQTSQSHDGRDSARSGAIADGAASWISTSVRGPGTLTFWWTCILQEFFGDHLEVYLDGSIWQDGMIGGWQCANMPIPKGAHTVMWMYRKNWVWSAPGPVDCARLDQMSFFSTELDISPSDEASVSGPPGGPFSPASLSYTVTNGGVTTLTWTADADAPWLTLSTTGGELAAGESTNVAVAVNENALAFPMGFYRGTVTFHNVTLDYSRTRTLALAVEQPLCDALEACSLDWRRGGAGYWFWQTNNTHDGADAAQSGLVGNNQASWMETTIKGPATLSFWAAGLPYSTYHRLEFYIDGALMQQWLAPNWTLYQYPISNGFHDVRWRYVNESVTGGMAIVDQVSYVSTALAVSPSSGFSPCGRPVGPYSPAFAAYALTNRSLETLEWEAGSTTNWVDIAPLNGVLAAGEVASVTVTPNAVVATLALGTYGGSLLISNRTDGQVYTRPLTLVLEEPICEAVDNCALQWSRSGSALWHYQTSLKHDGVDAARSGAIGHNSATALSATLEGPGELSFLAYFYEWGVYGYNGALYVRLDGNTVETIDYNLTWGLRTLQIPAGAHTVQWLVQSGYQYYSGGGYAALDEVVFVTNNMSVAPSSSFESIGIEGGPFIPACKVYAVSNLGPMSLTWSAGLNADWCTAAPSGGVLSGGAATNVAIVFNAIASNLTKGVYTGQLVFSNETHGVIKTRNLRLEVEEHPFCEAVDDCSLTWLRAGTSNWSYQTACTHDGVDAARSGAVGHSQDSWAETVRTGPGECSFWWKVSSEGAYDFLTFLVDGAGRTNISGEVNWKREEQWIPAGVHTQRWRYAKNAATSYNADGGWLDEIAFVSEFISISPGFLSSRGLPGGPFSPVSRTYALSNASASSMSWHAHPTVNWCTVTPTNGSLGAGVAATIQVSFNAEAAALPLGSYEGAWVFSNVTIGAARSRQVLLTVESPIGEALDYRGLPWSRSGNGFWFHQTNITHDGVDALQSAPLEHAKTVRVETTVRGPGQMSFWWKVSSQAYSDYLRFKVNAMTPHQISGEADWQQVSYALTNGLSVVAWEYTKNVSGTGGQDCAWLDDVIFPCQSAIPEWWLNRHRLPIDGSIDYDDDDRDGYDNWREWRAGTDPTNDQSFFRCSLLREDAAASEVVIRWLSATDRTYRLQHRTNLLNSGFTILATNLPGQVDSTSYTDTTSAAENRRFYRVLVE